MKNISEILSGVTEFRRCLHRIPELAGTEFKTMTAVRERISGFGLEVLPPFLKTDTVAILRGGRGDGKNVTLRADIDALELTEKTGLPYASGHPGKMHACGHDVHSAILVGAAEILSSRRNEFAGSVRFIWQPGEENHALAKPLIESGALDDPKPDLVTALHVFPGIPTGSIATKTGPVMASCSHFHVSLRGKGGHGSRPHQARNPLVAAAAMVSELQGVISNRINAQRPAVLSVCHFKSGELDNVIPDEACFSGTIRALDMETAEALMKALREICSAVAAIYRVDCDVDCKLSYPATINHPEATALARKVIADCGIPYVELTESAMSSEDFSYYLNKVPGVFVRLGIGEDAPDLHSSCFNVPEEALSAGIEYMVNFALEALR